MPPDERREALIVATLPLLREFGMAVSTRQIADAAGVAEGTIFGVFPDKASLLRATVLRSMDPVQTLEAINSVDRNSDLRTRLSTVTEILIRRMSDNAGFMAIFRNVMSAGGQESVNAPARGAGAHTEPPDLPTEIVRARQLIVDAVTDLIAPDADQLRVAPDIAAKLLVSVVFVAGRGGFGVIENLSPADIVGFVLDGLMHSRHD